jgi:hypothetical protein
MRAGLRKQTKLDLAAKLNVPELDLISHSLPRKVRYILYLTLGYYQRGPISKFPLDLGITA